MDNSKKPDPPEESIEVTHQSNDDPNANTDDNTNDNNNDDMNINTNSDGDGDVQQQESQEQEQEQEQQQQSFSPVRGNMDEETFEFADDSNGDFRSAFSTNSDDNDAIENAQTNGDNRSPVMIVRSPSNDMNEDEYIEEFPGEDEEGSAKLEFLEEGQHNNNNTTTSPVIMFDLSAETEDPLVIENKNHHATLVRPTSSNVAHIHVNTNNNKRSQSKLLVRHLTRAAILSQDDDEQVAEMSPALKRRLRDFRFAQRKRRERYGEQNPWGIIGLYDHLTGIRTDIEWAEDAAWRRENDHPYLSWQDFEDAKDTGFNQPFFTYFTMSVCTICLLLSIALNGWNVQPLTENPMIGPSAKVLLQLGAKQTSLIVNENEWYRIFTCMFLHAGIIHFVVNMLALWFVGYAVEQSHGFFAAALLFILPAIGGTLFSALFLPEYISVGASGGIFGLIGACLADIISNWGLLFSKHVNDNNTGQRFRHIKVLIWLVLDIILNIVIGLTPFVDNFTHMGGMLFGFFCGLSTMERLSKAFFGVKTNFMSRIQIFLVRFFGIIFSVICILTAFILLASMKDGQMIKCRGCRYISCVPFPFWETENKWWYCDDCNRPIVRGQLYQDPTSLYYTHMDLTCPDNSTVTNITLTENTNDEKFFQSKLDDYCRIECDVLFSN